MEVRCSASPCAPSRDPAIVASFGSAASHVIRKVVLRQTAILNYVNPP